MASKTISVPNVAKQVEEFADNLSQKTDRWWLAFLMAIGIAVLAVMLYWHREDQRQMTDLYSTTIRQNTEALTRVAAAMDRLERKESR